jgi:hypothetical protein
MFRLRDEDAGNLEMPKWGRGGEGPLAKGPGTSKGLFSKTENL